MNLTNTEPVFKTVGQALFTAFAMEITEPSTPSPTGRFIEDLMEKRYGLPPVPIGERSVDLGEMNPDEMRAQCGLIRKVVEDHIAAQERDTIWARFGHQTRGFREHMRPGWRLIGVHNLRDHYASLCNTQSKEAILELIWAIYAPGVRQFAGESVTSFNQRRERKAHQWSVRGIESRHGVAKSVLHRDQQMLRKLLQGVENIAQTKLERVFISTRLITDPNDQ